MHPTLFQIGTFKVASFGAMMVVAFLVALTVGRKRAQRTGITPDQISDVCFWAIIGGILGARLFFIIQELPYYLKNPDKLITVQFQGLTSFGGFIVGGLVMAWVCKKKGIPVIKFMDIVAPAFVLAHAFGRVGCLLNGCCHGQPAASAFPFLAYSAENHTMNAPAQLYDSLMNIAAFFALVFLERKNNQPGYVVGMAFFLHGITRFVYEFFRAGASSTTIGSLPFTEGHAMALVISLFGLFVVWKARKSFVTTAEEVVS